jgi:hypothetical protein
MARPCHPDKSIEAALKTLESLGWRVGKSKGRSAHAWGYVLCPANEKALCRNGVFCQMQVWSTPTDSERHAKSLLRAARGCVMTQGERGD